MLPSLKTLDCDYCPGLKEIPVLPSLTGISCDGCNFSFSARLKFLFDIYRVDEQGAIKSCKSLEINESLFQKVVIDYFNSKEEISIPQKGEVKRFTKGELRKQAFRDFPFLFYFLAEDIASKRNETSLPVLLGSAIDNGNAYRGLSDYYGISTKILQNIPFSLQGSARTTSIIEMIQQDILKPEWLPQLPKGTNLQSPFEQNSDKVFQKFLFEQKAFCDVVRGCIRLSEELGFKCDKNYPDFVIELIKNTAKASPKSWQKRASALPVELRADRYNQSNVIDAIDDFLRTVFLPYRIQSDLQAYQPGSAQKLLSRMGLEAITQFLKGVSLGAICELSSHWHEAGRAAQLNKAKTFSDNAWEPLFSPSITYQGEMGSITAVSLTTSAELQKEGKDLDHCVRGYTYKCLQTHSHIVSLRDENGKSLSTIELQLIPGNVGEGDPTIINIKGESAYHLRLNQHHGARNQPPSPLCKEIEAKLFDDIREGRVLVDLRHLEVKLSERLQILKEKKDIVLIGYDPTDEQSFKNAKAIYRRHGIRNIACEKTFRSNFDLLTGEKREQPAKKSRKKASKQALEDANI